MKVLKTLLFLIVIVSSFQITAQTKKELTTEDYSQWHRLKGYSISEDGKWFGYKLSYESGKDTLYLSKTDLTEKLIFPGGEGYQISPDGKTAWINTGEKFEIVNLNSLKKKSIQNVVRATYCPKGRFLAVFKKQPGQGAPSQLVIRDLKKGYINSYDSVSNYSFSPDGKYLALTTSNNNQNHFKLLRFPLNQEAQTIHSGPGKLLKIEWSEDSKQLVFLEQDQKNSDHHSLYTYDLKEESLDSLIPSENTNFPKGHYISSVGTLETVFAKDGERLFLPIMPEKQLGYSLSSTDSLVQVWNASDVNIFPAYYEDERNIIMPKLSVWNPGTDEFLKLADENFYPAYLTGDQKHVVLLDKSVYGAEHNYRGNICDILIREIATGKVDTIIKGFYRQHENDLSLSPEGKFIAYFQDKNWWTYNVESGETRNLTENLDFKFHNDQQREYEINPSFGAPGWTSNDEYILLYSAFDIWLIKPDGSESKRITRGREENISFRMELPYGLYVLREGPYSYDLKNEWIFTAHMPSKKFNGYYTYNHYKKRVEEIFLDFLKADYLVTRENGYYFIQESFEISPRLIKYEQGKKSILVQPNKQQEKYYWGKAEVLNYTSDAGDSLQAALFYPSSYDPNEYYPMIVQIYENTSKDIHTYFPPREEISSALNNTDFTQRDYFVLMPDIYYEESAIAKSLKKYIHRAVDRAVHRANVDPEKLGLYGRSFGGYETCLAISQTNMFKAAVAGCPMSDLVSFYLSVRTDFSNDVLYFTENHQMRMNHSLYENPEPYLENSPVLQAKNINTPLLVWHGTEDGNVPWQQGIEMYNALRRLNKDHVMLAYPGQTHVIVDPKAKRDLFNRVMAWYDYYLKKGNRPDWYK